MEHVKLDKAPDQPWTLDVATVLNCSFDVACLISGIYILSTRSRALFKPSSGATSSVNAASPLSVHSVFSRKRLPILLASTAATILIHLTRLLLILALTLEARRVANVQRSREAPGAMDDMEVPPLGTENEETVVNPLLRAPALYGVLALPMLMLLSRGLAIVMFAVPANKRLTVNTPGASAIASSPTTSTVPVPASPRARKGSSAKPGTPTSPTTSFFPTNGHGPTSHAAAAVSHVAPSPIWQFVSSLPKRVRGPTQNLYLLAFYACLGIACVFVPFTYHLVWYFDTPRVELVLSLYLAAVLRDAKNVPGLNVKEKRARGIYTLERIVYFRWAALALMFYGISFEASWRVLLDGSIVYILWRVDV